MVAVVSGNGLGLDHSSLRQLGLGLGGVLSVGICCVQRSCSWSHAHGSLENPAPSSSSQRKLE